MKTIVYLVERITNSGPENVVLDICRNIDRNIFNVKIIVLQPTLPGDPALERYLQLGFEISFLNINKYVLELFAPIVSKKVLSEYYRMNGDLLHSHCYHSTIIASHIKGIPIVSTIHGISGEDTIMAYGPIIGRYMQWRADRSLKRLAWNVPISDYMVSYYDNICSLTSKINNGVSVEIYPADEIGKFKKANNIPSDVPILIVTGAIIERKNVTYIIEELKKSNNRFLCLIVGDGEKINECKLISGQDSRFRFCGFRNDVSKLLQSADIYISASKSEGLPLSVLEAVNAGLPCVLSSIPPHIEIQENMNVEAITCFNLDEGCLRSLIEIMINKKYDRHTLRLKAHSLYSATAMTRSYEQLYNSIIESAQKYT